MPGYINEGHLRTTYTDIEDFALMHIVFEDGTFADIFCQRAGTRRRSQLDRGEYQQSPYNLQHKPE